MTVNSFIRRGNVRGDLPSEGQPLASEAPVHDKRATMFDFFTRNHLLIAI